MTIPLRGRSNHFQPVGDAFAKALAQRLVASGREGGPRRAPPTTPEEHAERVEALATKLEERGRSASAPHL